jgi:hypothetical protein
VEELANGVARAALSRRICTHDKNIAPNEVPDDSIKATTVLFVASAVFLMANGVFIFQRVRQSTSEVSGVGCDLVFIFGDWF